MKVLNVAEKPSVAKEISNILSSGRSQKRQGFSQYNPVYEFPYEIQGQRVQMVVTSVIGHLMEMDFDVSVRGWHSCDPMELFTAPVVKRVRPDDTQAKIAKTLTAEARQSQWLVLWLDCDREGENIAFEVKSVCERASSRMRVFRAKFSALIPRDIIYAVQNLSVPNEKLSLACDARSEIDLRIGAAFTRFQTMRIQAKFPGIATKEKGVISYGPCQFPTLGFVVERFLKIQNFEREPFYSIAVTHRQEDQPNTPTTTFKWKRGHLFDRLACLCIHEVLQENPVAIIESVDKKPTWKRKPLPLTTVELQKRASRWLRISSEQAMKAAESLYNKGFVSYPRTETNKFKEGTDLMALVTLHENHEQWGSYVSQKLLQGGKYEHPRHGGGDDQAHPPIHPTKCVPMSRITDMNEKKVYEFITLHFLACCSQDAKGNQTSVEMKIMDERFSASGLMVTERNYLDIYKYEKWNTSVIPVYERGDTFNPTTLTMTSGETAPPPLLSEADLIAKMDTNAIGTDATIAEHIKTILKREYVIKVNNDTQFKPTTLGLALVLSYEQMGLDLAKPALRAAMENDCKSIALGQKDIKDVVRACMVQMKQIFADVSFSADILDQTFADQFNNPICDAPMTSRSSHSSSNHEQRRHSTGNDNSYDDPPSGNQGRAPRAAASGNQRQTSSNARSANTGPSNNSGNSYSQHPAPTQRGNSSNGGGGNVPLCPEHNLPCVQREAQRGDNQGRLFYVCSLPQTEQCQFFMWTDDASRDLSSAPKCTGHNEPCAERTVRKEGANKGRLFYSCPRPQTDNCGFFEWKDEASGSSTTTTSSVPSRRSSTNGSSGDAPQCTGCNLPCVCRTARKPGDNQNREFFACSRPTNESCGYFLWKDEWNPQDRGRNRPSTSRNNPPPSRNNSSSSRSNSNSNSNNNALAGPGTKCECGLPATLLTCRQGANQGRTFYKCPNPQDQQCNFFAWAS